MLLVKLIEPPCTERYARWCERSGNHSDFPPTRSWGICSEAVRGGVVAVRAPAGDLPPPDRRYTVAHRCTANLLGRFWCRSPQCRGRAVQKASELCTAHPRSSGSPSFPQKRTHKKVHLRTQTDPLTPKTTHERSSPIQ